MRSTDSRRARLALIAALIAFPLGAVACNLKALLPTPVAQVTHPPKLRFRFALLAPFDQVAGAANAELKSQGHYEKESHGDSSVRFTINDEEYEGHDTLSLREDANILIIDFTVHKAPDQGQKTKARGESGRAERAIAKGGSTDESDDDDDGEEKSAAKKRAEKILKLIVCLPGVGDQVDRDGKPRATQLREKARCSDLAKTRSATTPDDAGAPIPLVETIAGSDAGKVQAPADAGRPLDGGPRKGN